ncbi:MAG: hypothetical protein N4Q30_00020 [Neisseriaceae bacterium]|nr:hypothetical protein [Neisseriaceae bacterium]
MKIIKNKILVDVKFEHKNHFKVLFPDAFWRKGKGWEIDDTLANHEKLELWYQQVDKIAENEILEATKKIQEGIETISRKIQEQDSKINTMYAKLGLGEEKNDKNDETVFKKT